MVWSGKCLLCLLLALHLLDQGSSERCPNLVGLPLNSHVIVWPVRPRDLSRRTFLACRMDSLSAGTRTSFPVRMRSSCPASRQSFRNRPERCPGSSGILSGKVWKAQLAHEPLELWPITAGSLNFLLEDPPASRLQACCPIEVQFLVLRRDPGIPNFHPRLLVAKVVANTFGICATYYWMFLCARR